MALEQALTFTVAVAGPVLLVVEQVLVSRPSAEERRVQMASREKSALRPAARLSDLPEEAA